MSEPARPRVTQKLTEAHLYLAAILMDQSGLDQAEFMWKNPDPQSNGVYRARPYQWRWWRCRDPRQIDQCSRSVGKTEGIMARILAFPFSFRNLEQALVAPQQKHIKLIAARVEPVIQQNRFYRALLKQGVRNGITHNPFEIFWANGSTLVSRLPQLTGLGLKGLHPVRLEVDEGQDIDDRAYAELPAVVRWEIDGARWMIHGVPKGVIDRFYKFTLPDSGFRVHRILAMHDASWTPEKAEQSRKDYGGSKESPDYQRNVYGEHSQSANRIVLLKNLYACTDSEERSDYNTNVYQHYDLSPEVIMDQVGVHVDDVDAAILDSSDAMAQAARELLAFPESHREFDLTWGGMDFGLVADPSELLVGAEYTPSAAELAQDRRVPGLMSPKDGLSRIKLLTRITMKRLPPALQAEIVMHVCEFYKLRTFAMDATGNGLGTFMDLQRLAGRARVVVQDFTADKATGTEEPNERAVATLTRIKGYKFDNKILVGFHEDLAEKLDNPTNEELAEKAGIWLHVKDFGTDQIRELVDNYRFRLPHDEDLLNDINAQTWSATKEVVDPYTGRRRYSYSVGTFHILDGLRMLVVGRYMTPMEEFLAQKKPARKPVLARFGV